MAILAECPKCHNKQSVQNRACKCGEDLIKAKKARNVRYWIKFRLPGGKQRKEYVGYSIEEARDADGKRRGQKRENRIFDMLPASKITFDELSKWYLNLNSVKRLASYDRTEGALKYFNAHLGQYMVNQIKQTDLEDYQDKRKEQGRAGATIDMEIKIAQTMVTKAFDNDMVDGHALKAFRRTKRLLKTASNARKALVSIDQYLRLIDHASPHYRVVLIIAFNTGMRLGEIRNLKWSHIDKDRAMIRLSSDITKERGEKPIPINHHVKDALNELPRAIQHDFVITYQGKALNGKNSLKKQFPETCEKAKIPYGRKTQNGITFHDIRRTFKTNMAAAGVDKVYRDSILGHSLKGMDVHYIVPTDETLTKAMNQYTNWLDSQIELVLQSGPQTVPKKREKISK